jgi:hypothetical protein
MVLDELKQRPSVALKKYADAHGIRAFTPAPATQPVVLAE